MALHMKLAVIAALLLAPLAASAQPAIPVPQDILGATVAYLQNGGTHNEGMLLAKQIIAAAQPAAKPPAPTATPPETPAP